MAPKPPPRKVSTFPARSSLNGEGLRRGVGDFGTNYEVLGKEKRRKRTHAAYELGTGWVRTKGVRSGERSERQRDWFVRDAEFTLVLGRLKRHGTVGTVGDRVGTCLKSLSRAHKEGRDEAKGMD